MADNIQKPDDKVVESAICSKPAPQEPAKVEKPQRPRWNPTEMSGWMAAGDPG